jgi:hypothetical protein
MGGGNRRTEHPPAFVMNKHVSAVRFTPLRGVSDSGIGSLSTLSECSINLSSAAAGALLFAANGEFERSKCVA